MHLSFYKNVEYVILPDGRVGDYHLSADKKRPKYPDGTISLETYYNLNKITNSVDIIKAVKTISKLKK